MKNSIIGFLQIVVFASLPIVAQADVPLTALTGHWEGTGRGRPTPFQSFHNAKCKADIQATPSAMHIEAQTFPEGMEESSMVVDAKVDGNKINGSMVMKRGKDTFNAKLDGQRQGDTAMLKATLSGAVGNIAGVNIELKLINPNEWTMSASAVMVGGMVNGVVSEAHYKR